MSHLIQSQDLSTLNTRKTTQILASLALGLIILSTVAFAPLELIHNATHDSRHSSGFPCH